MRFKVPKNDAKYHWTNHVIRKMMFYGLTPDRVKRIIRAPKRKQVGVVPDTIAVMQPTGTKKKPTEVWAMYQLRGIKKIIITAWRYPTVSPIGKEIPIPVNIINELKEEGVLR